MSSYQHDQKKTTLPPGRSQPAATHQAPLHPLLQLGQQVGNAQVAQMLAQRTQDPTLQREASEEEDVLQTFRDPQVQRNAGSEDSPEVGLEGGPVSSETAARIQTKRGSGSSLADGVRTKMEAQFNTDFSDVRIHTDSESAKLNQRLGATAFTTGSDIFFGANGNAGDQHLLGHELTHVVQQRSMSASGPMTVGPDGDHYEQEASQTASQIKSGPVQA